MDAASIGSIGSMVGSRADLVESAVLVPLLGVVMVAATHVAMDVRNTRDDVRVADVAMYLLVLACVTHLCATAWARYGGRYISWGVVLPPVTLALVGNVYQKAVSLAL
jgi:hypothetical protein